MFLTSLRLTLRRRKVGFNSSTETGAYAIVLHTWSTADLFVASVLFA